MFEEFTNVNFLFGNYFKNRFNIFNRSQLSALNSLNKMGNFIQIIELFGIIELTIVVSGDSGGSVRFTTCLFPTLVVIESQVEMEQRPIADLHPYL